MVSLEGLLWYIFPVERLVGLFRVELFFPAKKAQDDRREVVRRLQPHAADAKQVQWVAGAEAPDGFPHLKHEIWPRNE